MGDAEIIPIGTRGKPGRGTGEDKPSAPSRSLAGRSPSSRSSGAAQSRSAHPSNRSVPAPAGPPPSEQLPPEQPHPEQPHPEQPPVTAPGAAAPARPPVTAHPRQRTPVISPKDLLAGLTAGAMEVFGDAWEPRLAEFLALVRRRLTGEFVVDDFGFDQEITDKLLLAALRPVAQKWFRIEVLGVENIPRDGGALVVSNHSGTVPIDGLMTGVTIFDHTGRHLRPLGADLVFKLPVLGDLARKGGATLACNEDAERMLSGGELVGVWPEGFKGIGKPFSERYKLQRFGRGGFVAAALRTGVPIIPTSVVGAEEIYPLIGNIPSLARLLGVPYLPITPLFPLLGPLGLVPLPSKWLIEFGEPIRTDAYDAGAAEDPMLVFNVTDQVRESIQQTLYSLLMKRRSVFS